MTVPKHGLLPGDIYGLSCCAHIDSAGNALLGRRTGVVVTITKGRLFAVLYARMTNVLSLVEVNHIFGDVRRVVGNAFQTF